MTRADTPVASREIEIVNTRGLHARASAKFVKCAESFEADIKVTSIMGLMMLAAQRGSTILIEATGPDADRAVEALSRLILDRFGED